MSCALRPVNRRKGRENLGCLEWYESADCNVPVANLLKSRHGVMRRTLRSSLERRQEAAGEASTCRHRVQNSAASSRVMR